MKRIRSFTNIIERHEWLLHILYTWWRHGGHVVAQEEQSINFSPLGTKLYFHVNSSRKNDIVLTFNKAAFSRDCKPRITSYLIAGSIWPVTMPPQVYPRDLQFFLFLVVYSPPPGMQKETIPHPRAPDQPYICVLGVHLFKSKIDFHEFVKIDVLSLIPHA